jgi:hypothetical protein
MQNFFNAPSLQKRIFLLPETVILKKPKRLPIPLLFRQPILPVCLCKIIMEGGILNEMERAVKGLF